MHRPLALITVLTLLGGCGSISTADHGPRKHIDFSGARDAVPQCEQRTRAGNPDTYVVRGQRYTVLKSSVGFSQSGIGSWYGKKFHGRKTSNGERYDMYAMTAAHKTLPIPSYVRVTNLDNGRSAVVRINDRGPFHDGRIIDLSYAAASKLGYAGAGTARVAIEAIEGCGGGGAPVLRQASAPAPIPALPPHGASGVPEPFKQKVYVQLGAFISAANAEQLRQRLAANNITDATVLSDSAGGQAIYRVRIGPLNVKQADTLAADMALKGLGAPKIVLD